MIRSGVESTGIAERWTCEEVTWNGWVKHRSESRGNSKELRHTEAKRISIGVISSERRWNGEAQNGNGKVRSRCEMTWSSKD